MHKFFIPMLVCILAGSLVACDGEAPTSDAVPTSSDLAPITPLPVETPTATRSPTPSPTPPAVPANPPPTSGPPTATCKNGWATPAAGTPEFTDPLGIIRRTTGVMGPLVVVDMRRFTGSESPPSPQGYLQDVERWYIKLYAQDDLAFQGRFLVESRTFGRGLAAVAPYDTKGYRSPDWVGFQYNSSDTTRRRYPGLPGRWSGIAYDFVRGGAGLKIQGLPDEVSGCLAGT